MKKSKLTFLLTVLSLALSLKSWSQCSTPAGLEAFNITPTSATLAWEAVPGAIKYAVKILNGPNTPIYEVSVALRETSLEALGLSPDGEYSFKVLAWCRNGGSSAFSRPVSFRTPPAPGGCDSPTGLFASDITNLGATLNWDAQPDALKYELELSDGDQYFLSEVLTQNSYPAYRLASGTAYKFRVRAECSNGDVSDFSPWIAFMTDRSGAFRPQLPGGTQAEAYPNPADQSLNLMFPNVEEGELVEVMAFNANGQLLRQFSLTALKGQPQEIDVAGLPDGMYFILAESDGIPLARQKVMISHK